MYRSAITSRNQSRFNHPYSQNSTESTHSTPLIHKSDQDQLKTGYASHSENQELQLELIDRSLRGGENTDLIDESSFRVAESQAEFSMPNSITPVRRNYEPQPTTIIHVDTDGTIKHQVLKPTHRIFDRFKTGVPKTPPTKSETRPIDSLKSTREFHPHSGDDFFDSHKINEISKATDLSEKLEEGLDYSEVPRPFKVLQSMIDESNTQSKSPEPKNVDPIKNESMNSESKNPEPIKDVPKNPELIKDVPKNPEPKKEEESISSIDNLDIKIEEKIKEVLINMLKKVSNNCEITENRLLKAILEESIQSEPKDPSEQYRGSWIPFFNNELYTTSASTCSLERNNHLKILVELAGYLPMPPRLYLFGRNKIPILLKDQSMWFTFSNDTQKGKAEGSLTREDDYYIVTFTRFIIQDSNIIDFADIELPMEFTFEGDLEMSI